MKWPLKQLTGDVRLTSVYWAIPVAILVIPLQVHGENNCNSFTIDGVKTCSFVAKKNITHVYTQPNKESVVIFTKDWLFTFHVRLSELKKMPSGWLRVSGTLEPAGKEKIPYDGWVELNTLTDVNSLRRVTSCWPIKHISYSQGDYSFEASSKLDGRYYVKIDSVKRGYWGQIYFADNVVEYRKLGTNEVESFAGYDAESRKLFTNGYEPDDLKIEYFDDAALKSCVGVVTKSK